MAAVCLVFCCGGVEVLVDNKISVPAFSQSKASFSVMPLSFMLFSNTDMISWNKFAKTIYSKWLREAITKKNEVWAWVWSASYNLISILPVKSKVICKKNRYFLQKEWSVPHSSAPPKESWRSPVKGKQSGCSRPTRPYVRSCYSNNIIHLNNSELSRLNVKREYGDEDMWLMA